MVDKYGHEVMTRLSVFTALFSVYCTILACLLQFWYVGFQFSVIFTKGAHPATWARSEQIRTDQNRSEQIGTDQNRSEQIRTDQKRSEQIRNLSALDDAIGIGDMFVLSVYNLIQGVCLLLVRYTIVIDTIHTIYSVGTRVPTRVWAQQATLVPGYHIPECTYPSIKYHNHKHVWHNRYCTRVHTRVRQWKGWVPRYPRVWYPGTYPSVTMTTRLGARVPQSTRVHTRVHPSITTTGLVPGYPRVCTVVTYFGTS